MFESLPAVHRHGGVRVKKKRYIYIHMTSGWEKRKRREGGRTVRSRTSGALCESERIDLTFGRVDVRFRVKPVAFNVYRREMWRKSWARVWCSARTNERTSERCLFFFSSLHSCRSYLHSKCRLHSLKNRWCKRRRYTAGFTREESAGDCTPASRNVCISFERRKFRAEIFARVLRTPSGRLRDFRISTALESPFRSRRH